MNTYLMKKGGRIPAGSAGGNPRGEQKPRTEDRELEAEEGEPTENGLRGGTLAAAEHANSTPKSKWNAECEKYTLSTDAPEGVVGENKEEFRVQPFSCSGATSGRCTHRKADK